MGIETKLKKLNLINLFFKAIESTILSGSNASSSGSPSVNRCISTNGGNIQCYNHHNGHLNNNFKKERD